MDFLQTTLCYLEKDGCYLMLHRVKKKNDANHDKWVGVGGKFEPGEDALACVMREVTEETGLTMQAPAYRGIVDFYCTPWPALPIWQGDKIFFDLLAKDAPFFHLELHYEGDTLAKAVLDGEKLALL